MWRRRSLSQQCHHWDPEQAKSRVSLRTTPTLGIVPSPSMRKKTRSTKLATSLQLSSAGSDSVVPKTGMLFLCWLTTVRTSMCALHETLCGSTSCQVEESASGHTLTHCGEQCVPMYLRDGLKIWITFKVCEVQRHIMPVGKFCATGNDRCATFRNARWNLVA